MLFAFAPGDRISGEREKRVRRKNAELFEWQRLVHCRSRLVQNSHKYV
jgi:hypothetical protein